jgi:hypothetical protein
MWEWPIQLWTWTSEARLTAMEPKWWRSEWTGQRAKPRALKRGRVAPAQRARLEVPARLADEDGSVVGDEVLALPQSAEPRHLGDHRHRGHLAALRRHELAGE